MGSLRVPQTPRTVVITRRREGSQPQENSTGKTSSLDPSAQAAKERGKKLFQEEQWEQAAQAFTEALGTRSPPDHTLLTNRALCNQKLLRWDLVEQDARLAVQLSETSVKAHYLLGKSLQEMGRLEEAQTELTKSMSLSSSKQFKSYRGSIEVALLSVRKRLWMREQAKQDMEDELTRGKMMDIADACLAAAKARGVPPEEAQATYDQRVRALCRVLGRARRKQDMADIPEGMVCKLSRRIMIDPVSTPHGQTYERADIEKHLTEKGPRDPFRKSDVVSKDSLVPNLALKKYIDDFLEENPWAFQEPP
mmetsp:Transcript_2618/g.7316  ORF Transcript_2618/g.7316 Transcript_2618/m.7316 type:complete len:308 (+) Transcript_2618:427-1350(+)